MYVTQRLHQPHLLISDVFTVLTCMIISVPFVVCQTWQNQLGSSLEFFLSAEERTCEEAQSFCAARGGHTAILHNTEDRQFLNSLVTDFTINGDNFLIGLYKAPNFREFEWRDRTAFTSNDDDRYNGFGQRVGLPDCACTVQTKSSTQWQTTDCDTSVYPFVCSRNVDRCSLYPCIHGGTCSTADDVLLGYMCACSSGWEGITCHEDIDECLLDPPICQNGATCTDTDGSYRCDCGLSGYEGKNCSSDKNECLSDPPICKNGATCTDTDGSYHCDCGLSGYEGKNCSSDKNECLSDPPVCKNGATCVNTDGSYECDCGTTGFEGKHCTSDVNECIVDPSICENGICSNTDGSYSCSCEEDFEGRNCETKINDCNAMNGTTLCTPGYCVDGVESYTCVCPDGTSETQSCPEENLDGDTGSFEDESNNDDAGSSEHDNDDTSSGGDVGNLDDSAGETNAYGFALIFTCLSVVCSILQL